MRPYSPGGEEEPGQNKIVTYIVYHCTCSVQVTLQRLIKDNQLYSISPQKIKKQNVNYSNLQFNSCCLKIYSWSKKSRTLI